jgi:hypothetical protein
MWSVYAWWGLWELSLDLNEWKYSQYWFLMMNLSSIYFFTTLVLPKATDEGAIDLEAHYYSVHKAFFSIVAFSLFTSVAVNHSLFGKPMLSDMTIMPFIVGCAAIGAAVTESRLYHKIIGVFMFLMFIAFQLSDQILITYTV